VIATVPLVDVLPVLACPWCGVGGLQLIGHAETRAEIRCPGCGRTSPVTDGVWDAMGDRRPARTAAQLTNALALSPVVYERFWRPGATSRFAGRPFPIAEELEELRAAVQPRPGALAIDVGCAEGLYARALAGAGMTVIAFDHSGAYARKAHRRAREVGVDVVAVRASAQHLPLLPGSVDAAVMGGTLNEVGDQPVAVAEMARVCRTGGRLFSLSLLRASTRLGRAVQRSLDLTGIHFPTRGQTEALWEAAGFQLDRTACDGIALRVSGRRR
jgi:SAM-dependent methyltransferase